MKCFHRTPDGPSIIRNSFHDNEGTYMTGMIHRGVWLSDRPLSIMEGAKGNDLLVLDIPDEVLVEYEWVEEEKTYREFLVPAEVVNSFGPPRLCDEDEEEEYDELWNAP